MSLDPAMFAMFAAMASALGVLSVSAGVGVLHDWRSRRTVAQAVRELDTLVTETNTREVLRPDERERPLQRLLNTIPNFRKAEDLIAQAALGWSIEKFVLYTALFAFLLGVPLWLRYHSPLLALIGLILGAGLPRMYVGRKARKRMNALEFQLIGAIDHLQRAVQAGHPLTAGLKMLAEDSPQPISDEFRGVFEEQRYGLPFDDALLGLADRVNLPDVRILITAVLVNREVGGNLAEILSKVGATIRARFVIRRQVKVYTVQGRMSGYILAALPIFVGSVIYLMNPEYISVLFTHPIGKLFTWVAATLQFIGFLWIRKIVNVEY